MKEQFLSVVRGFDCRERLYGFCSRRCVFKCSFILDSQTHFLKARGDAPRVRRVHISRLRFLNIKNDSLLFCCKKSMKLKTRCLYFLWCPDQQGLCPVRCGLGDMWAQSVRVLVRELSCSLMHGVDQKQDTSMRDTDIVTAERATGGLMSIGFSTVWNIWLHSVWVTSSCVHYINVHHYIFDLYFYIFYIYAFPGL